MGNEIKILNQFEFANNPDQWEYLKSKWVANIEILVEIKEYVISLIEKDCKNFTCNKYNRDNLSLGNSSSGIGIECRVESINDNKGFFKDRIFMVSFSFAHFENIDIVTYYKYEHKNNIGWKPVKRNNEELKKKFIKILFNIGYQIGSLKTLISQIDMEIRILRNDTSDFIVSENIINSLPIKTRYEQTVKRVIEKPTRLKELFEFEDYIKTTYRYSSDSGFIEHIFKDIKKRQTTINIRNRFYEYRRNATKKIPTLSVKKK